MDLANIRELSSMYKTAPKRPFNLENPDGMSVAPWRQEEQPKFSNVLEAAMGLLDETNTLKNEADNEAIRFELGLSENTHDLMIAEQKATTALQYTTAVRDHFLESYNMLMQMQI